MKIFSFLYTFLISPNNLVNAILELSTFCPLEVPGNKHPSVSFSSFPGCILIPLYPGTATNKGRRV